MDVRNKLYKGQGIHLISNIFTVEKGIIKVFLVKRKSDPYKDSWALIGGALYNNENLEDGMYREIEEKTGIKDIKLYFNNVFGKVDRSPIMRMVAVSYIGVIPSDEIVSLKDNLKDTEWFPINDIPKLAYDHHEILMDALNKLKKLVLNTDILKSLFPNDFTLPELQKTYEIILNEKLDRRNFRRKILNMVEDTNKEIIFEGTKPAKLYRYKK